MPIKLSLLLSVLILASACGISNDALSATNAQQVVTLHDVSQVTGFAQALQPRSYSFPEDHGAHPTFQSEWWYYTGNLEDERGNRWGYQFTIFRRALSPESIERESNWATNQVYFAHLAISDIRRETHQFSDRYSRGAGGLAGAQTDPLRIWIEDWEIMGLSPDGDSVHLRAKDDDLSLDLVLEAQKPIVAHGDNGLSPKSDKPGNASYYLSFPRMKTIGAISIDGETYNVQGESWFDHEWSTSALGEKAVGWDWFGLQLDNGYELMLFTIRQDDGSIDPVSGGTLIRPDGSTSRISNADFTLETLTTWLSTESGVEYPSGWRIVIPSEDLTIEVLPAFEEQEMRVGFIYWEGAVDVKGSFGEETIIGRGYVELTGYAESMRGIF